MVDVLVYESRLYLIFFSSLVTLSWDFEIGYSRSVYIINFGIYYKLGFCFFFFGEKIIYILLVF